MLFPGLASKESNAAAETASFENNRFLSMEEMMIQHIHQSLLLSKGKIDGPGGAAERLDMHASTLRARMKKLNIKVDKIAS